MTILAAPTNTPKKAKARKLLTGFGGSAGLNTFVAARESKSNNASAPNSKRASKKSDEFLRHRC